MGNDGELLPVHDVLSVFTYDDDSHANRTEYIVIELLTAEGLLVLKTPRTLARNLADELSRSTEQPNARWAPDYRTSETINGSGSDFSQRR